MRAIDIRFNFVTEIRKTTKEDMRIINKKLGEVIKEPRDCRYR